MSGGSPLSPWTVIVHGLAGQEVSRTAMRSGVPVTIGRAPDSTIMLGTMTVARNHGRIELVNGVPTYVNEPGAAGSTVDGDPVEGPTQLGERTLLEIGGFRVTLARARPAATAAPRRDAPEAVAPASGGGTLLDRHIQGLKMHRTESQKEHDNRLAKWEQGWKQLVTQARDIQARYGRHPRVLEFAISKDEREVVIKLKEESRRGYSYFCLSRAHPEGKYPDMQAVWLREVGRGDESFSEPSRGLEELVSRIAPRII